MKRVASAWLLLLLASQTTGCKRLFGSGSESESKSKSKETVVRRPQHDVVAATIYDGGLKDGWQDWGWGTHDLSHGAASIDLSNYGGWILFGAAFPNQVEGFSFRMAAPRAFGTFLQIKLAYQKNDEKFPPVELGPRYARELGDGWVEIYVPWAELNPAKLPVDQLTLHAHKPVSGERVRFDKLVLTAADPKAKPKASETRAVKLSVDCRAAGRPISPYIYGVAGGGEPWDLAPTGRRWGGNRTTRYNWQRLVTNAGKDWFFENTKEGGYREYLAESRKHGVSTALTLPIIGWVAKDDTSSGFPVSKLGPQQATDQWRHDAGNGLDKDGKPIRPGPPTQTSVSAEPDFIRKWVEAIRSDDQRQGARSVQMYILDNEPNLWSTNHRDVHPDGLSYDELLDRSIRYGKEIRAADPGGLIAGPAEWGWSGYFFSAKDLETGAVLRPDRRAHGDLPLVPWYLQQLREHEAKTGSRILDVLDLHFYPQGAAVYSDAADAATSALRIRSTRALWDPTYKDESWIDEPVRLIPRMKEWIQEYYPGLRVSIGEYSFGAEKHMSGALALAEALGRFGTEGVDYAYYWVFPPKGSAAFWAFRAYRNFDGQGGRFLDRSLPTTAAGDVSLFASRDDSGKHVVLVALNFDPSAAVDAQVSLSGCAKVQKVRKFVYTERHEALSPADTGAALRPLLPPYSISVLDVTLE